MLESVFIILFAVGFVTFLLGLFDEWDTLLSLIMCFVSILFFLGAWAGSVYIVIPGATAVYSESGFGFICMGLIIINAIGAIVSFMQVNLDFKKPRY